MSVRLLVVAHDASRTGAPRALCTLLRWLADRPDVAVDVLVLRDGPLAPEMAVAGPVEVVGPADGWTWPERVGRGLERLAGPRAGRPLRRVPSSRSLRRFARPDVVLLNGAPAAAALDALPWPDVPVVAWVHELDGVLSSLEPDVHDALFGGVDRYVAVAGAVERLLVERCGVHPARVVRHAEMLDPADLVVAAGADDPATGVAALDGRPVVLAAGAAGRRKGADLFVQLAVALRHRSGDPPQLVWVGQDGDAEELWPLRHDVAAAGLGEHVHLLPPVADLGPWLRRADVVVVPSREDPSPLVALEAAWWRTPLVGFDAGGLHELLGRDGDGGALVAPLDVGALADAVLATLHDPAGAAARAEVARARVVERHLAPSVAPALWQDVATTARAA